VLTPRSLQFVCGGLLSFFLCARLTDWNSLVLNADFRWCESLAIFSFALVGCWLWTDGNQLSLPRWWQRVWFFCLSLAIAILTLWRQSISGLLFVFVLLCCVGQAFIYLTGRKTNAVRQQCLRRVTYLCALLGTLLLVKAGAILTLSRAYDEKPSLHLIRGHGS